MARCHPYGDGDVDAGAAARALRAAPVTRSLVAAPAVAGPVAASAGGGVRPAGRGRGVSPGLGSRGHHGRAVRGDHGGPAGPGPGPDSLGAAGHAPPVSAPGRAGADPDRAGPGPTHHPRALARGLLGGHPDDDADRDAAAAPAVAVAVADPTAFTGAQPGDRPDPVPHAVAAVDAVTHPEDVAVTGSVQLAAGGVDV